MAVEVSSRRAGKPAITKTSSKRPHSPPARILPESRLERLANSGCAVRFPVPVSVTSAWFCFSNLCYLFLIKSALRDVIPSRAARRFPETKEPTPPKQAAGEPPGDGFWICEIPKGFLINDESSIRHLNSLLPRLTLPLFLMEGLFVGDSQSFLTS